MKERERKGERVRERSRVGGKHANLHLKKFELIQRYFIVLSSKFAIVNDGGHIVIGYF